MYDFLLRLLPFTQESDILTSWWVMVIIVVFAFLLAYLWFRSYRLVRLFANPTELQGNDRTKTLYINYRRQLRQHGGQERTDLDSDLFLNEHTLINAGMNWPQAQHGASLLVGLGVLGTFVGLTYGIINIDPSELEDGVANLLAGTGAAFVTSIWGMATSIVYGFCLKYRHHKMTKEIRMLNLKLDEAHKFTPAELAALREQEQRDVLSSLLNEYFVYEENDEVRRLPKDYFHRLAVSSDSQVAKLDTLANEIADQLQQALDDLADKNSVKFSELIEEKLVPVLTELKNIKQDSGAAVVQEAVEQLKESMMEMLQQFKSTLGEESKAEMELLTSRLVDVSTALLSVPEQIERVNAGVQTNVDALSASLSEDLERSRQQQQLTTQSMAAAFEQTTGSVATTLQQLQQELEQAMGAQVALAGRVQGMMTELQTQLAAISRERTGLKESVAGVNVSLGALAKVADDFEKTSTHLASSAQQLNSFNERLRTASQRMVEQNEQLNESQRQAIAESATALVKHREGFGEIQRSLDSVFASMSQGLSEYQQRTSDSLSEYLGQFSSTYGNAQTRTDNQISILGDRIDDLAEVIERAKDR